MTLIIKPNDINVIACCRNDMIIFAGKYVFVWVIVPSVLPKLCKVPIKLIIGAILALNFAAVSLRSNRGIYNSAILWTYW
jgi:hypothetical protein